MSDSAHFSSECPTCKHERLLTGYTREELVEMLRTGADIEAYCSSCDEYWPVSTEERADLARALVRKP
jgi:redox-regulated HSP33 family molecular chaperone